MTMAGASWLVVAQGTEGAQINRSLVGALFTRTCEHVTFVVDNLSSFERRARENACEKASALESAGQAIDRNVASNDGEKRSSDPTPSGRRLHPGMWWSTPEPDRPNNALDKQIAAIALVNDMTVVTRSAKDFEGTGLSLMNPFHEF